jgi:hypothetical protein
MDTGATTTDWKNARLALGHSASGLGGDPMRHAFDVSMT